MSRRHRQSTHSFRVIEMGSAWRAQTERREREREEICAISLSAADKNDDKGHDRMRERGVEELRAQFGLWSDGDVAAK